MKANITRSGSSETWLKTEYFCPKCGSERVWVNEEQLRVREDEQYICILCAFMFTMPVAGVRHAQMSGFEFMSVVRRRFPEIAIIAVSGAYQSGEKRSGWSHRRRVLFQRTP
jgi:predicted RNA-binding Zn-ribbon protein involved in translation (DUF1610 family)